MKIKLVFLATTVAWALMGAPVRLVAVGGGAYPPDAMARLVEWSGGPGAQILIVAWGIDDAPGSFERISRALQPYGAHLMLAPDRVAISSAIDDFQEKLSRAGGIFFTGGDQTWIMEVFKAHPALGDAMRAKANVGGAVVGGSSAGTAILSERMFTGEGDFDVVAPGAVGMDIGIGILPDVLLDQHFIRRRRLNRLMSALLQGKESLGLGIDEGTAAAIEGRTVEVLGASAVMQVKRVSDHPLFEVAIHGPGSKFEIGSP